uniref:NADH dehydrogenase subunit 5 n=1 Tax=Curtos fulvocapitalis TaxID=1753970 RepID=UPI001D01959E|nr:NADH dehydrogenase subunit 5 [Curtos fulvocapitalis]QVG61306.1 NADH dehydrogenase subunit 5 [Curtos fulvocapitalis]
MISICLLYSFFLLIFSFLFFFLSLNFMMFDLIVVMEYELMSLNSNMIFMSILLDWMSLLFMSFVLFISSMVIYYSEEYMYGDMNINRFISLVFLFVMSMMFLIISPNLISILLGWDGLGLVSYCLVIYYQNLKSLNAGMLTALSNRIGDVGILMSIAWMMNYGSWNFIFYLDFMKDDLNMKIISYFIILSALTKSAQIPFSSWLPAAMAAPTPVSSLVHSSTLVTAGVYLLIRFNFCFSLNLMYYMLFISMMTMFMSGLGANFEFDLKKIIALSTLSQLGLMMSILFLGDYKLAFFHLLSHALFKALLFMCAGYMIHNLMNYQDIRFMGSLINSMPLTCTFFNISNFSLCGFPFLAGFYSKDLILEVFSMNYMNMFVYMIFYISIGLTVSYSFRLSYYTLFCSFNFNSSMNLSDQGYIMLKGMMGLIFMVILGGSMLSWLMYSSPIYINLSFNLKMMVIFLMLIGLYMGYELSKFSFNCELKCKKYYYESMFIYSMFNLPILSTYFVNYYFLKFSNFYYKNIDLGWLEYFGSQNLFSNLMMNSKILQILFNNNLKVYIVLFMVIIFLLFI